MLLALTNCYQIVVTDPENLASLSWAFKDIVLTRWVKVLKAPLGLELLVF